MHLYVESKNGLHYSIVLKIVVQHYHNVTIRYVYETRDNFQCGAKNKRGQFERVHLNFECVVRLSL